MRVFTGGVSVMKHIRILGLAVLTMVVAIMLAGCGGGDVETPLGAHHIAASFYDGARWNDAVQRTDAPGLTGPAGHWDAEVVAGGMSTQGGTVPVGTCTMYDKAGNVVERTGKDWELNGDYRVVGRNARGDILAEAFIWANPEFGKWEVYAGVPEGNGFGLADQLPDGTWHGPVGPWSLGIRPANGQEVEYPSPTLVLVDTEDNIVTSMSNLNGRYTALLKNAEGRVITEAHIWADPNFGRG